MYEFNGGALNMLLKKKDFYSALMKVSLPVGRYAETVQAAGDSTLFSASYHGFTITKIDELRTARIVGGIK